MKTHFIILFLFFLLLNNSAFGLEIVSTSPPQAPVQKIYFQDARETQNGELFMAGNTDGGHGGTYCLSYQRKRGVIVHWNGEEWREMAIPLEDNDTKIHFYALWGDSDQNIYAVGKAVSESDICRGIDDPRCITKGAIYHFNGNKWEPMKSGAFHPLYDIEGKGPNDIFAVGEEGTIVHYDGHYWHVMDSGTDEDLSFISTAQNGDLFAVSSRGTIFLYDGYRWRRYREGPFWGSDSTEGSVSLIRGDSKENICVEWSHRDFHNGNQVVIDGYYHYNGLTWEHAESCEFQDKIEFEKIYDQEYLIEKNRLNAVWGINENDIFTVGGNGMILHYDGTGWTETWSPTEAHLKDIHGSGRENLYAVGDAGTILFYDGFTWQEMSSGILADLNALYVASENFAVAVGDNGVVLQYDGSNWFEADTDLGDQNLIDVWGVSKNDIYALVERDWKILHYDGVSWNTLHINNPQPGRVIPYPHRIWGTDSDHFYLLIDMEGDCFYNHVYRFDGTIREVITSTNHFKKPQFMFQVHSMWGTSAEELIFAGENGSVAVLDNQFKMIASGDLCCTYMNLTSHDQPLSYNIRDVWGTPGGDLHFVGDNRTILKWSRPDRTPPRVLATDPASGMDTAYHDPVEGMSVKVKILFSEPVDPDTLTDENILVLDKFGNFLEARKKIITPRDMVLELTYEGLMSPQSADGSDNLYRLVISSRIKDLYGNQMAEDFEWAFSPMKHINTHQTSQSPDFLARIYTSDQGIIDGIWHLGGEDMTPRGDRVLWGYFYSDPDIVSWGSANNPDLFVKIWFDVNEDVYFSYLHESVPQIQVYSANSTGMRHPTDVRHNDVATLSNRYVGHYYLPRMGTSKAEFQSDFGDPAPNLPARGNPTGYRIKNDLRIGAIIQTEDQGPIEGVWRKGGEDRTARGDQVVWGYFYADPKIMNWGSSENPDLFVKIWFDVTGYIVINYFHASIPNIEVYSDYPGNGSYDQRGTTTNQDRYIRHFFVR